MVTNLNQNRIDVADVLRGISVAAIGLLHAIEHYNFYSFPESSSQWLDFANTAVWDSLFFMFAGKAYAIFALLFGFSFFIQDNNAKNRGIDFRGRFMWRLLLLLVIGHFNAALFTGEILVLYALLGFVLPLFARASNKVVLWVAIILMLQPMEIGRMIYAIMNPDFVAPASLDSPFWGACRAAQSGGSFFEMVKVNLWEGQLASLGWAFENARMFQTPALFLLGMLIGRTGRFLNTKENNTFWFKTMLVALLGFFCFNGLSGYLADYVQNPAVLKPLSLIVVSLAKFGFMCVLVSSIILMYYKLPKAKRVMDTVIPYGRMSMTNYILQSLMGTFLFYHWGLQLNYGSLVSVLIGVGILVVQYVFCRWWLKSHRQGPMEYIWKKATWI